MDGANLFDPKDSREARPPNPSDKEAYTEDIRLEWGLIMHADSRLIPQRIRELLAQFGISLGYGR